jgi:ABC-type transport system involved in multi-copper enzyme maturation permease subunit
MRGSRAYWLMLGYLLFLSFILFIQYTFWWNKAQSEGHGFSSGSKIGQEFFQWIMITQAFLVAFITPAITSGAITIEKEQRTMEMLELTRLSRSSIVVGKLLSAVGFVILLVISSLPLASICFFLGGVSPGQMGQFYLQLISGSFVAGALGLVWSTVARSTAASVILTYASLLVPVVCLIVAAIALSSRGGSNQWDDELLAICCIGLFGVTAPASSGGPNAGFARFFDGTHFYGLVLPNWLPALLTYGLIALTLTAVASVRLETFPERKAWVLRLLVLGLFFQQCFFFFGARFSAHMRSAPAFINTSMNAYPFVNLLAYPIFLLLFCLPIFSTGEIKPGEARNFTSYLVQGWKPENWKLGRLSSGLPFLCALGALILGMYWLSFAVIGQPGAAGTGKLPITAPVNAAGITKAIPPGAPLTAQSSSVGLVQIAIALFTSIVGLYALGVLYSLITRNRWVAMMLSYATVIAIFIIPLISKATYSGNGSEGAPSIFINLFYLNPLMSISQASDRSGTFWKDLPLMFSNAPIWQITMAAYLFIILLVVLIAMPFVTKVAGRPVSQYDGTARA